MARHLLVALLVFAALTTVLAGCLPGASTSAPPLLVQVVPTTAAPPPTATPTPEPTAVPPTPTVQPTATLPPTATATVAPTQAPVATATTAPTVAATEAVTPAVAATKAVTPTATTAPTVAATQATTVTATAAPTIAATQVPTTTAAAEATVVPTAVVTSTASAAIGPQATVKVGINMRSGPGTNYAIIGAATPGQALTVTGQTDTCAWLAVKNAAGHAGWVSGSPDLVTLNAACDTIPAAPVPPAPTPAP